MLAILALAGGAFLVALSGAMAPGALLVVTVGQAARHGARAGVLISLGHSLLELALVLALAVGLAGFLAQPLVSGGIALFGAAVLAWMAWSTVREGRRARLPEGSDGLPGPGAGPVLAGVLASAGNPYWLLWWASIGAGSVVLAMRYGWIGLLAFYLGHISADFLWYGLVAAAVGGGRRFLAGRVYGGLLVACGVFLFLFAAYFVRTGWLYLFG